MYWVNRFWLIFFWEELDGFFYASLWHTHTHTLLLPIIWIFPLLWYLPLLWTSKKNQSVISLILYLMFEYSYEEHSFFLFFFHITSSQSLYQTLIWIPIKKKKSIHQSINSSIKTSRKYQHLSSSKNTFSLPFFSLLFH